MRSFIKISLTIFNLQSGHEGRNGYVQCSKGNNSKSRQTRVTVYVFYMSFYNILHLCEVWWKYLEVYQIYGADTNDGSADGQMDTQNFGQYNIIPQPLLVVHKNVFILLFHLEVLCTLFRTGKFLLQQKKCTCIHFTFPFSSVAYLIWDRSVFISKEKMYSIYFSL